MTGKLNVEIIFKGYTLIETQTDSIIEDVNPIPIPLVSATTGTATEITIPVGLS